MTIEARHLLLGVLLLLLGWIAVLALVLRFGGPAPAALVVWPPEGFLRALPPDVSVTSRNALGLTARGGRGPCGRALRGRRAARAAGRARGLPGPLSRRQPLAGSSLRTFPGRGRGRKSDLPEPWSGVALDADNGQGEVRGDLQASATARSEKHAGAPGRVPVRT